MRKIGNLYETIQDANGNTAALKNANHKRIRIDSVEHIPEIGPSGVIKNDKLYRLGLHGNYVSIPGVIAKHNLFDNASGTYNFGNNTFTLDQVPGWVLDSDNTYANGLYGAIHTDELRSQYPVYFVTDLIGWIGTTAGDIFKTIDGGKNWVLQTSTGKRVRNIHFKDELHGWAVGDSGLIIRTLDGGATWELKMYSPTNTQTFSQVFVGPEDRVTILGYGWWSFYTVDDGNTYIWPTTQTQATETFGLWFVTDLIGWKFDHNSRYIKLWKTTDGGVTWSAIFYPGPSYRPIELQFVDENVGYYLALHTGDIWKTVNGGASWTRILNTSYRLKSLLVKDNLIWASGDDGRVYYSDDSGATFTLQIDAPTSMNVRIWTVAENGEGVVVTGDAHYTQIYETITGGKPSMTWGAYLNNTPEINDTILVKGQSDKTQNGYYKVTDLTNGILTRTDDIIENEFAVELKEDNTFWKVITTDPIVIGSTQIEWEEITLEEYESILGISLNNRLQIYPGQEVEISYREKPDMNSYGTPVIENYLPIYVDESEYNESTYKQDLENMENDVIVEVVNTSFDGNNTFIDVLSDKRLYDISAGDGTELVVGFNMRRSQRINTNYPDELYVTNLQITEGSPSTVSMDFYFTNKNENAISFIIAYRKSDDNNTAWTYIENSSTKYTLSNLDYDKNYEIKVMTLYDNDNSTYSPSLKFRTV